MTGRRVGRGGTTIDRGTSIAFRWGGRQMYGLAGDTLASALLANGVSVVGRSFKYHRPRGVIAAGLDEPNAIVQLEEGAHSIPNMKATQVELYAGLIAKPVNAWPSIQFDMMAVNAFLKRFIPAAFYYKTFFWPNWRWFEPIIRRAAGLGKAPTCPDPDRYVHRFSHADVLVIGSGAAGLAAAEAAAAVPGHNRVVLVENDANFGGGLLASSAIIEGVAPLVWRDAILGRLKAKSNVTLLARTLAFGFYDHGLVGLCERLTDHLSINERIGPRQRMWKIRCSKVILATGAFERPIPFSGNDLPGVMLASAAQTYALRFGVLPGRVVTVCTNNDSAYEAAFALQEAGCIIAAIVDTRAANVRCVDSARSRGISVFLGAAPLRGFGNKRIRALQIVETATGQRHRLACDTVLTSDGWNPVIHLHSQSGGDLIYNNELKSFLPSKAVQSTQVVGAAAGIFSIENAIEDAGNVGSGESRGALLKVTPVGPTVRFKDRGHNVAETWVDFQNDVTVGDIQLAARENFQSIEHLKRYTTLGMASDQGKTSNVVGIHILADLLDKAPERIGTTRFRPPFDPVTIGAFAGRSVGVDLAPLSRTPSHDAQVSHGAIMETYGSWLRPAFFLRPGENEAQAIIREVQTVRSGIGLLDASTLGKIEVKGPDAAEFLQRMYVNNVRNLKVGTCRYGLMLDEHGIVFDDGVLARLAEDHFLVGTTSGHAAAVTERFEEWLQCEWPDLRVMVENVTTGWAVVNVAGRHARAVLAQFNSDIDLSLAAFPHMTIRTGRLCGVPARIQRVSFTGELSYEVAVPWGYGAALWNEFMRLGQRYGIVPFGIESLMVMRVEKGFLHVGSDTDGTTYPQDIGFAPVIGKKPDDFVGRRSTMRSDALRENRRQLVGLEVVDGKGALETGAHIVSATATRPEETQGWVTSSVYSPTVGRPLAMALVERGFQRTGEEVLVWDLGRWRSAKIADPRFFDPDGMRLNG